MAGRGDNGFARASPGDYRPLTDGVSRRTPGGGIPIPRVSRSAQGEIGASLRGMYDELLAEPVPEAFADLIRRLK